MGSTRTLKRRRQRHRRRAYLAALAAGLITPVRLAEVNEVLTRIYMPGLVEMFRSNGTLFSSLRRR